MGTAELAHPDDSWHNLGAGAMQIYWDDELRLFLGFNNGIFRRRRGRRSVDGSVLLLYTSPDATNWQLRTPEPILSPDSSGRFPWKDALVYQMGLTGYRGMLHLYYNARNSAGKEYIGLATCPQDDLRSFLRSDPVGP